MQSSSAESASQVVTFLPVRCGEKVNQAAKLGRIGIQQIQEGHQWMYRSESNELPVQNNVAVLISLGLLPGLGLRMLRFKTAALEIFRCHRYDSFTAPVHRFFSIAST